MTNQPDIEAEAQAIMDEAINHHQHGRTAEAREGYLRLLEMSSSQPDILHLCGVTLFQEGNLREAEGYIRAAIAVQPGNCDYHSNLGLVLKSDDRYDEAIASFEQALAINGEFADCLNNLGSAYVAAGRADEAESVFRRLLDLDRDHAEACNNLAVILSSTGGDGEAAELFDHALALRPHYVDAHLNYARMLFRRCRYEEAASHFEAAIRLEDTGIAVYRELGDALRQAGRTEDAMEICRIALEKAPQDPDCHVSVGSVFQHQGDAESAESCYRRALELEPDNARANNNMGTVLAARNELSDAIVCFTRAIQKDPELAEAVLNKGAALQKSGRLAEAAGYFSMALARNPRLPSAYRYLSEIYRVSEMRDSQVKVIEQWLEYFPDSPTARHLLYAAENAAIPERASDDFIREEFDGFAESFDETLAGLEYSTPRLIAELLAEELGDLQGSLDVLDAGCGTGLCGEHLTGFARTLVGVDLSTGMLAKAAEREIYSKLIATELVAYMYCNSASFDLVVSADTLVYFGPLQEVFESAAAALRPGGRFVFSVELLGDDPDGFRLNSSGRYSHGENYVRANLAACGFEVLRTEQAVLRTEAQQPVQGLLVFCRLASPEPGSA